MKQIAFEGCHFLFYLAVSVAYKDHNTTTASIMMMTLQTKFTTCAVILLARFVSWCFLGNLICTVKKSDKKREPAASQQQKGCRSKASHSSVLLLLLLPLLPDHTALNHSSEKKPPPLSSTRPPLIDCPALDQCRMMEREREPN